MSRADRRGRRWPAVLAWVAGATALLVIAATLAGGWLVQRSFPQTSGTLSVAGLDGDVRVLRDQWGVSDVYATTAHDLFFAQGFVHAQDRFWEMDVRRHITAGRLSEMFGSTSLDVDEFVRTLGWRRVAEQELQLMSPDTRDALDAYAQGVNAYLSGKAATQVSLEYAVLGLTNRSYRIEPWTAVDSLSWLKAMAWDLRGNIYEETQRALIQGKVGDRMWDLFPPYPTASKPSIVMHGAVVNGRFEQRPRSDAAQATAAAGARGSLAGVLTSMDDLDRWLGAYGAGVGSNSFAVNGDLSATGGALLANDPHLAPSLPGIWYQMGLHCTVLSDSCPYDVAGFTFSGVPGVVIGHNNRIAWGFTNLGPDVTDLYYEAVQGDQVLKDGRYVPLDVRQETIDVAGSDPVTIEVRSTDNGPLISDVDDTERDVGTAFSSTSGMQAGADETAVALRWTALDPGTTGDAILALDRAQDFDQFREAARLFEVPSQNMLYADVDGNIGYQAPGRIPVRGAGDGTLPQPGWDPGTAWRGYVPFAALPHVYDPPEHYIVTANNQVIDPTGYPYLLTKDWTYGYRAQQITDDLLSHGPHTVDDLATIQTDTTNGFASTLVPALLAAESSAPDPVPADVVALLSGWDGKQDSGSAAAAYYNACWRQLLALAFGDELTGDLAPDGSDRWFEVVRSLLDKPDSPWWDDVTTGQVETRDEILQSAMRAAYDELVGRLGSDPSRWTWGAIHTLDLKSGTFGESGIWPLERLFNRGPVETSGGQSTVLATSWTASDGYQVDEVPSMRMVVDLSNLDASRWVNLTGQSGHVFSPHYWDQTPLWRDGGNLPWAYTDGAVAGAAVDQLDLTPAG